MPGYIRTSTAAWRKLYDLQAQVGNSWRRIDRAYVLGVDGAWHLFHQYVANVRTSVDVTSTSGLSITGAPTEAYTVSGVMRNADTGTPLPGGLTVKMSGVTTTTAADGSFTLSWKPPKTGGYTLVVSFAEQGVYQASSWSEGRLLVSSPLTISVNWPTNLILGKSATFTGTVTSATGEVPTGAVVSLFRVINGSATEMSSVTLPSSGAFSIPWTTNNASQGSRNYYIKVSPTDTSRYPTTWGAQKALVGYQPTPSTVSQAVSSISNTSVKIKIEDQAYVDYFISRCTETGNTVRVESTGTAGTNLYTTWGISPDSTYHFITTAYSDNPSDNNTSGNTITVTTGHAAVSDSGSGVMSFNSVNSASWRSVDGWAWLGTKLGQGYYSTGSPYFGVAEFNNEYIANYIASYGGGLHTDRVKNISVSKLEVYLDRVLGSGSSAAVKVNFYCSNSHPNSGTPTLGTSALAQVQGPVPGAYGWDTLPSSVNTWFHTIVNAGYSLVMYANNSSQYAIYYGLDRFKIRATLSWNYTEVAYKAPSYSNG